VSHYVRDGDALDLRRANAAIPFIFPAGHPDAARAALQRPGSLNAEVDRLCMACDMAIGAKGKIGALSASIGGHALACEAHLYLVAAALADPRSRHRAS